MKGRRRGTGSSISGNFTQNEKRWDLVQQVDNWETGGQEKKKKKRSFHSKSSNEKKRQEPSQEMRRHHLRRGFNVLKKTSLQSYNSQEGKGGGRGLKELPTTKGGEVQEKRGKVCRSGAPSD